MRGSECHPGFDFTNLLKGLGSNTYGGSGKRALVSHAMCGGGALLHVSSLDDLVMAETYWREWCVITATLQRSVIAQRLP